jgi:Tfp pilus assembly protein FimT
MTVVLVIAGILISIASGPLASYNQRLSARRAAEVFAMDLTLARSRSLRNREWVSVKFNEVARTYMVRTQSGLVIADRRLTGQKVKLSAIDLALPGDSIAFSSRGVGNVTTSLGTATFTAGSFRYRVQFNPMGSTRVTRF